MASDEQRAPEQQQQAKLEIYSASRTGVSSFWREKYEKDAKKYWDIFYKRHQDRFFKDRHYLDKEWGNYFSGSGAEVILEVGCGVGNTIFPLVAMYPELFVYACDFSPRAINLVKTHMDFKENRMTAFVCDLTVDDLSQHISPCSVDIVTMVFVLSAVSPEKMPNVLQNVRTVLKPNGYVLFRDYATGDLAQERFMCKDQMISENFYIRGDGTRAFYFSDEYLASLFKMGGFDIDELGICCKQVENRGRGIVMNRRWMQAVFRKSDHLTTSNTKSVDNGGLLKQKKTSRGSGNSLKEPANGFVVDMSEGFVAEMFGMSSTINEIIDIHIRHETFKLEVLPKEHQHTCKSTGLMLWESARLMASILCGNPAIVAGRKVLELGCGGAGICSMIAARTADLTVATDGDAKALDLLCQNIASNINPPSRSRLIVKQLDWGNRDHIEAIKEINGNGFDIVIGTDVAYVPEAIFPLFATVKELISSRKGAGEGSRPALILCHVIRRVDEPSILLAASRFGFGLVDWWLPETPTDPGGGIVASWFVDDRSESCVPTTALRIMYFQIC